MAGVVGMAVNFAVTLLATPFFPGDSPRARRMVESIREPEAAGPAVAIETAPEH